MTLKIIQIVTHLNIHDAIGNDILAIDEVLKKHGYNTLIMASNTHEALRNRAKDLDFSHVDTDDLVLFHKGSGDKITKQIAALPCKRIMIYHNITPAKFFIPYDLRMALVLSLGRLQLRCHAPRMNACWSDSNYNAQELQRYGVPVEKITVLPILFSEKENHITPDSETERRLQSQTGKKLLCIGRIAPNKKLEDSIKVYARYFERYDSNAILYLLGSWNGHEKYYAKLKDLVADLGLSDKQVVFTGNVTESEKEAYLRNADALICQSEHEGFCVPLLEAMKRDLPVLAYSAAAVPETVGNSDLLFPQKDYNAMADALEHLYQDAAFRAKVLDMQRENLKRFDQDIVSRQFIQLINQIIYQNEGSH